MNQSKSTNGQSSSMLLVGNLETEVIINALHELGDIEFEFRPNWAGPAVDETPVPHKYDLILCAFESLGQNLASFIHHLKRSYQATPIILLSTTASTEEAVELMRGGASGLVNPTQPQRLVQMVKEELARNHNDSLLMNDPRYASIVEHQTEMICRYDLNLRLTFVNRAYAEWLGKLPSDLLGEKVLDAIPPDDRHWVIDNIASLTPEHPVVVSIHQYFAPDGVQRWSEWTNRALFDDAGQISEYQAVGRDVTDRERQTRQLQEDKATLQNYRDDLDGVLNTTQDALLSIGFPDRHLLYVSASFEKVFGYPLKDFLTDPTFFTKVVHPDDIQLASNAMQTCLREGFVELDHRIVWPDGQVRWIHRRAWVNFDNEGQPIRLNDSARDITERKVTENELRARQEQLKSLIESQTSFVIRTDLEGRYTYWNPKFEREFGWLHEPNGMLGQISLESICAYHHPRAIETVDKCLARPGVPFQVELDKPARDVGVRTTLWEFICLTDTNGIPTGVQCVGIDITAQKQAQSVVQYQASLLQQVSEAIIATDNELIITNWNQAATKMYGWTEDEAIGQPIDELLRTEWFAENESSAQATIARSGQWRGEIRQTDKAGQQHYINAAVSLLHNDKGEPSGGVTTNRDITLQKRREILQERISHVLEETAAGLSLSGILKDLAFAIEEFEPDIKASVLLLDQTTLQLRHGAAPSLPDTYNAAIDGIIIGSGVGSCGTAAFEKRLVIVSDIATDPLWKNFKDIAANYGLKACWSQPIMGVGDKVLGTFALYYAEIRQPTEAEIDLIQLAARIAGLAIRHSQTQADLQASEEKYRSLIESSDAAISLVDYEGRYLYLNWIAAQPFGVSPDELTGKTVVDLFPPDQAMSILHDTRQVMEQDQGMVMETEVTLAGNACWFRTSIQPVRDAAGKPYAALVFASEITDKKAAEAALRASEARYRNIVEDQTELVCRFDQNLKLTFGNRAYCNSFGTRPEAIVGQSILSKIPPEEHEYVWGHIRTLTKDHPVAISIHHSIHSDGTIRWQEWKDRAIFDDRGSLIEYQGVGRDITDQKRAEDALRESEQRLRLFIEHAPAAIAMLDKNMVYLATSRRWLEDYRLNEIELVGRSHYEIFPEIPDHWKDIHRRCLNGAVEKSEADPFVRADGTLDWVHWEIHPWIDVNDEIGGILLFSELITGKIHSQNALRESEEKYRSLIESSDSAIAMYSAGGQLLYANTIAANSFGATPEQLVGKNITELFPPEVAAYQLGNINEVMNSGVGQVHEAPSNIQGKVRWYRTSIQPVRDAAGQTIAGLINAMDITDRKQAEAVLQAAHDLLEQRVAERTAELEHAKNRIEAIFNHSGDGILLLDIEKGIQQANYAFDQLFGAPTDRYFGASLDQLFHPDDAGEITQAVRRVAANHQTCRVEARARRSDDTYFDVGMSIAPVNRSDKAVINLVCIMSDITQRKLAQAALQEYAAQVQDLYNNAPTGYHSIDGEGTFVQINDTELAWFGYTREELVGSLRFLDLLTPASVLIFHEAFPIFKERGWIKDLEFEFKRKDGTTFVALLSATAIYDENGRFLHSRSTMFDITELKRAQQEVDEERNLLRTLIDAVPDYIYVKDAQHRIILSNRAHSRSLGLNDPREAVGKTDLELFPLDMALKFQADEIQIFETGEPIFNSEERSRGQDGREIWALTTKVPLRNLEGEIVGLVGTTTDISNIKANQEALRRSQADLKSVIDSTTTAFVLMDREGMIRVVNRQIEEMIQGHLEEPLQVGHLITEYIPQQFQVEFWERFNQVLIGEQVIFEAHIHDPNLPRHLEFRYYPVKTVDGEIIGVNAAVQDITDRKQAENLIRASEEKFRQFIESAPIATIITDQTGTIVLANNATETLFGYERAELINQKIEILVPERQREEHLKLRPLYMEKADMRRHEAMELAARRKDGSVFPADIQLSFVDLRPSPLIMSFVIDITKQVETERVLKQALVQEKELNELKSRFVSVASHEFRTPLAVILATSETLALYRQKMEPAQIDMRLGKIRQQVMHMKDLIDEVLQLARIQAGRVEFKPIWASLDRFCQEIVEEFDSQTEYQGRLVFQCTSSPVKVFMDERLMRHVVSNLISNALKYSPQDKPVYVNLAQDQTHTVFTVVDNGIGIPSDDLKHLFEPFHRASNVGTIPGTGLGLSITKQAIELHGGTIVPASIIGTGTTMIVKLPRTTFEEIRDGENIGD